MGGHAQPEILHVYQRIVLTLAGPRQVLVGTRHGLFLGTRFLVYLNEVVVFDYFQARAEGLGRPQGFFGFLRKSGLWRLSAVSREVGIFRTLFRLYGSFGFNIFPARDRYPIHRGILLQDWRKCKGFLPTLIPFRGAKLNPYVGILIEG